MSIFYLLLSFVFFIATFETYNRFRNKKIHLTIFPMVGINLACLLVGISFVKISSASEAFVVLIYWLGLFFCWFGIRSHLESSILLEINSLVCGEKNLSEHQLLEKIKFSVSAQTRIDQLVQSGYLKKNGSNQYLTTNKASILLGCLKIFS